MELTLPPLSEAVSLRGHLRALAGMIKALARPLDLDELFRAAYTETARAVDAQTFVLALYHEATRTVEVVRQIDCGVELAGGTFPIGNGLTSQVIRTRQSQLVRRWSLEGPPVRVQYASDTPGLPESAIAVPFLFGEQVLGVMSVYSYGPDAFDDDDLFALEVIAGQVAVAIAYLRNSDRLDVQIQRRTSESEAIFASMVDALLVVDAEGRLIRLNHAARELLCFEDTSIVLGQPLDREQWGQWPLGAQEVAERLAPMIEVLRRGQVPPAFEVELQAQGRRFLSFTGTALFDAYGALSGGLLVVRDITARHEVERLKDEMILIASHDLKAPVTVIKTQAQVLLRDIGRGTATVDRTETGLASIVHQVDRLSRLLDLLFDLSQIEAGRLEMRPVPMDLRELVSSLISGIRVTTDRHRLTLRSPPTVNGCWDERRLQQVISNLLTNAIKYSPNGGAIATSIRVDADTVTVRFRDHGMGLTSEDVPRVFERFYRAKGTRQLEGTGLGLYICHGIVVAHGGRIWAESAGVGHGSTFCFTLPREPLL